jgi:ketosteroid isomerase-like protein
VAQQPASEILSNLVEAFNRRDFDDGLQYYHPDIELRPGVLAPDQDTIFRGHDGVKEFLVGATEPWQSVTVERMAIVEAENDRFLALDRWSFVGRDGIEIQRDLPTVYVFRKGLITEIDGFVDESAARRAAGLEAPQ